jgi:hypothetical protein
MPARKGSGGWVLLAAVLVFGTSLSVSQADVVLDGTMGGSGALAGPDFVIDAVDGRRVRTQGAACGIGRAVPSDAKSRARARSVRSTRQRRPGPRRLGP